MKGWLRRIAAEPLVHFLLGGLLIFGWFAVRGTPVDPESRSITVTRAEVEALSSGWEQQMQRPPTAAELDALVAARVREEIYYREAMRLGLDVDDPVIRRRLRSKMEFLAASEMESAPVDDAVLTRWYTRHRAHYAQGARHSFDQIWTGPAERPQSRERAAAALAALSGGAGDWQGRGQPLSVPASMEQVAPDDVDARFGTGFAAELAGQPVGRWSGPVRSGYGWHVVRVRGRSGGDVPPLSAIRQQVENDWRAATMEQRREAAWRVLRDAYRVTVER